MHYVESPHRLPYEMASGIASGGNRLLLQPLPFLLAVRKPGRTTDPHWRRWRPTSTSSLRCADPRIYLYGGNPPGMPRGVLIPLLERIHEKLPR